MIGANSRKKRNANKAANTQIAVIARLDSNLAVVEAEKSEMNKTANNFDKMLTT